MIKLDSVTNIHAFLSDNQAEIIRGSLPLAAVIHKISVDACEADSEAMEASRVGRQKALKREQVVKLIDTLGFTPEEKTAFLATL